MPTAPMGQGTSRGSEVLPAWQRNSTGNVYVADSVNCTIRRVTPVRVVTTLVGLPGALDSDDGTNSEARFIYPQGVAVDNAGNLYVVDTFAVHDPQSDASRNGLGGDDTGRTGGVLR